MSVHIIVDSAADYTAGEAAARSLRVVPLKTIFGDVEYADGVDLPGVRFYEKLVESDVLPHTSQVTPFEFASALGEVPAGDEAVVITLSSKISGTHESACAAAADPALAGRVFVVDSESATIGERLLTERACALRDEGLSASAIAAALEEERRDIRLVAVLDTLEYLKRGGRVSAAAAAIGGALSIKPVIGLVDGEVAVLGKARGSKQGNNLLRKRVAETGVDWERPVHLGYTGLSDALLRKYVEDSRDMFEAHRDQIDVSIVGSTIGTHVGPGAIALAYFAPRG
ncbi:MULTISPECIES: DegV family protein [unclassified Adlercreutzia]|uniref:DegV family protein n=1 Tax=unclassified Adlercreutzia TaxID=2636013 RepID=UPI0013ECD689|nr:MULTISPECIES: DegV family protein [unclassified Adlercreutzia]